MKRSEKARPEDSFWARLRQRAGMILVALTSQHVVVVSIKGRGNEMEGEAWWIGANDDMIVALDDISVSLYHDLKAKAAARKITEG